jgi:hypothetical protein
MKSKILHILLVLLFSTMAGNAFAQKKLYAVSKSAGMIVRCNLDGTNLDTLISGLDNPVGATPSTKLERIFWIDSGTQTLNSCNFGGQNRKKLATFNTVNDSINVRGIAVDEINDKLYFIGRYGWGTCNPDGSNLIVKFSDTIRGNRIQINVKDSLLFWNSQSGPSLNSRVNKFNIITGKYNWILALGSTDIELDFWGLRYIPKTGQLFSTCSPIWLTFDSIGNYKTQKSYSDAKFKDTMRLVSFDYDPESKNLFYTHGKNGEVYSVPFDSSHHGKFLLFDFPFDIYDLFIGDKPLIQANNIQFSSINGYEFKANWNTGQWKYSTVFVNPDTTGKSPALDGVEYTANTEFGLGDKISGTNWTCVYNGTDSNITVTGLNPETTYRMMVCDRIGSGNSVIYNTNSANLNPVNIKTGKTFRQADNLKFSKISGNSFKVDWNTGYWKTSSVYVTEDTFGSATPWDKEEFTANTAFGLGGNPNSTSWYCVYNGTDSTVTVTGLDTVKTYRVMVCDRKGSGTSVIYNRSVGNFNPLNVKTLNNKILNNILPSSMAICSGDFVDTIKGSQPVGGNTPYEYKWIVSTTGVLGVYGNAVGDNTKEWYIPGITNQTAWYKRIVTDGVFSDTSNDFLVVVFKRPTKPEFMTYPSYDICVGTMYQNFAAKTTPPANSTYKWSAVNAEIYSQGSTKQFALVNFKTAGTAKVIIRVDSGGCSNTIEKDFVVGPDTNHFPKVRYFNGDFICEYNGVEKYQWGYDSKLELGGFYLSGKIDQNYFNNTTDTLYHYWVLSTKGGCTQKTYYNTPNSLSSASLTKLVSTVYPNPSNGMFNIVFNQELNNQSKLRVLNVSGVTVLEKSISGIESQFSLENMPSGVYMVQIMNANAFVSTVKVVKQ